MDTSSCARTGFLQQESFIAQTWGLKSVGLFQDKNGEIH